MWEWLDNLLNGATLRVRRRKALARFASIEAHLFAVLTEMQALGTYHDYDKEHLHIRQDARAMLQQLQRYRVTWGLLKPEQLREEIKRCLQKAI